MTAGLKTIIYPVKDLARAKALFGALLGTEPYADTAYYVGFKDSGQDVGLDPNGHAKGMTGPVPTGTSTTSGRRWRPCWKPGPRRSRTSRTWAAAG